MRLNFGLGSRAALTINCRPWTGGQFTYLNGQLMDGNDAHQSEPIAMGSERTPAMGTRYTTLSSHSWLPCIYPPARVGLRCSDLPKTTFAIGVFAANECFDPMAAYNKCSGHHHVVVAYIVWAPQKSDWLYDVFKFNDLGCRFTNNGWEGHIAVLAQVSYVGPNVGLKVNASVVPGPHHKGSD